MLRHFFKYELLASLRNKDTIIWGIIFPIAYLMIFYFAMYSLNSDKGEISTLHLVILPGEEQEIVDFLEEQIDAKKADVKDATWTDPETEEETFLTYAVIEEGEELDTMLETNVVDGVVNPKDQSTITVSMGDPIRRTIIKKVMEGYGMVKEMGETMEEKQIRDFARAPRYEKLNTENREEGLSIVKNFFFTAMAYVAFFPLHTGLDVVKFTEANQSKVAMRKAVAGVSKAKRFLGGFLPVLLFHLVLTFLTYIYARFLGMDLGTQHAHILLLLFLTTLSALITGSTVGSLPLPYGLKKVICIALPLFLGFIGGMMNEAVHTSVMKVMPWLHTMNPLGRASNGLYILYAEGVSTRYWDQITGLLVYIGIAAVITLIGLRRDRYASL